MRDIEFANEGYYHVFNRGVDQRDIFLDDFDRKRFYESLYLLNDSRHYSSGGSEYDRDADLAAHEYLSSIRSRLVNILSFCLMTNHVHLLLEQVVDGGISKFLHRLQMGYAKYFNRKYSRKGGLFDKSFRAVEITNDAQLQHVPAYIHLNVLDMYGVPWRDGMVAKPEEIKRLLQTYKWSSYQTYMTGAQDLPVIELSALQNVTAIGDEHTKYVLGWTGRNYIPAFAAETLGVS